MNERPPSATLFLHEDILARTLAYEQDQRQWRISELESGRDDPGRPTYEEVSSCPCSISAMPSSYQYFRYLMVLHLPNIACMPQTALRVSYGMRVAKSDHCISIMIVPALITQPVRMHSLSSILFYLYRSLFSTTFLAWLQSCQSVFTNSNGYQNCQVVVVGSTARAD